MPTPDEPENSAGQDPNPMQSEAVQSEFDKTMRAIEANDDMDDKMIQEATGAQDVVPVPVPEAKPDEPAPEPKPGEKEPEAAKPDESKSKEGEEKDPDAPPESDSEDRFAKLAKRGRDVGNRDYQVQQRESAVEQREVAAETRDREAQEALAAAHEIIESFKRAPIATAKAHGVDAVAMGQEIKEALANPTAAKASGDLRGLQEQIQRLEERLTSQDQERDQRNTVRAQAEAAEAAHVTMKTYMSEDAAKKAFPLAARLPEDMFRDYSVRAVQYLLQRGIDVGQDNICEVIEGTLEKMRHVYGDGPTPPPREAPDPKSATPLGQKSAPSIGNDSKTSGDAGPNWDGMSLGDGDKEYIEAIQREVASG